MVVEDTRRHPLLRRNPAVRELGWIAYAGVPLVTRQGHAVGAFSVVDGMPRLWSERDVALLRDLAACAASEIELRLLEGREQSKSPHGNGGPRPPDVFEDTGIPMGVATPDGRWTRVNQALCELLGYREEDLLGGLAEGIIHPDDRPVQREAVRLLLAGECPSYTSEYRCLRRTGEATWGLLTVTLVADAEGRPRHFVFAIQDISDRKRAETELRESEERYRLVVQATRAAAWDWDLVTNHVVWGEGLETQLGHAPSGQATTASWWYEHIHADDRERVVAGIQGALARGERSWEQEYRFRKADETYARVVVRSYVVTDRTGTPVRVVGAMADVTHPREVEEKLRSDIDDRRRAESLAAGQSRLLERIAAGEELSQVLDGIIRFAEAHGSGFMASLMTLDQGGEQLRLVSGPSLPADYRAATQVVPVGPAHGSCGTAAYRREPVVVRDIANDPLWEIGRDLALAAGLRACWSVPITSTEGVVLGTFANYYRERREPSADDLRIVELASHLAGIAIERSRNIEALAQSTRLLQQVLETLPVGVWVVAPSGRIVYGNAAGQQLWGGSRYVTIDGFDQFKGWWVETGRPIAPEEWGGARAVRHGEISLNELVRIQGFDGSERVILNSAVPIMGAGGAIEGAIVLNQDVSQQRAAEEALQRSEEQLRQAQKMEAVGQLAGGIAHDFNNLLTAILSYCDLLLQEVRQGDPLRSDVEQIRQAGQRAAGLTRQLLAFSRRQVLQPKVLSLNSIVSDTDGMLRRLIGADITLDISYDPGLWYVLADPGQIEQVLVNLVVNARDAMPQGGRLAITTVNRELHDRLARAAERDARGFLRGAGGERHRRRHRPRQPCPHLRAVLHHQGARQGHGAGTLHGLRHRAAERWPRDRGQRRRPRRHVRRLSAAPCRDRAGAGAEAGPPEAAGWHRDAAAGGRRGGGPQLGPAAAGAAGLSRPRGTPRRRRAPDRGGEQPSDRSGGHRPGDAGDGRQGARGAAPHAPARTQGAVHVGVHREGDYGGWGHAAEHRVRGEAVHGGAADAEARELLDE